MIAEDETKEPDTHGSLANLDSSPGTSGHKLPHGSSGKEGGGVHGRLGPGGAAFWPRWGGVLRLCTLSPSLPVQRDELREMFNDISSSEDEEDEGDRHEDEDLNIMDTEDDLERQLQEKLNESDGTRDEGDSNSQIGAGEWGRIMLA